MQKTKGKQKSVRKSNTRQAPAAISYGSKATPGKIVSSTKTDGSVRISRREFVGTLTNGSTTGYSLLGFSSQTPGYDFNPACGGLFPWLSEVSRHYEKFIFHKLSFHITPSQATSTAGRLYLAVDYDYDDAVASTKLHMMSNQTHVEGSVWEQLSLTSLVRELHSDGLAKYVTHNTRTNFVEPRTAYCGYLMIGVDTPTANLLFDLEVTYDVELRLPVLDELRLPGPPLVVEDVTANVVNYPVYAGYVCDPVPRYARLPSNQTLVTAVTPGLNAPALNSLGNSAYPFPNNYPSAFRIAELVREAGTFLMGGYLTANGITPHSLQSANALEFEAQFFDSNGTYLGASKPRVDAREGTSFGFDPKNLSSTPSAILNFVGSYALRELAKVWPTMAYMVPYLLTPSAGAITGAGSHAARVSIY